MPRGPFGLLGVGDEARRARSVAFGGGALLDACRALRAGLEPDELTAGGDDASGDRACLRGAGREHLGREAVDGRKFGAARLERGQVLDEVVDELLLVRDAAALRGAAAPVPLGDLIGRGDESCTWCSGQMSGSPGSVLSLRAGSVTKLMTFARISSGGSEMKMALP